MKKPLLLIGVILLLMIVFCLSQISSKTTENTSESGSRSGSETYISREIIYAPWGSADGNFGLKETEMLVQGIATTTVRYGPTKIEVDIDGNIFILDYFNSRLQKFSRIGKYISSTSFSEMKLKEVEKESLPVERFDSGNRYEVYRPTRKRDRLGIKIINSKTGRTQGKIDYQGLSDGDTYLAKPLGDDIQGDIYVLVDNTDSGAGGPENRVLKVYKYGKGGNLQTIVKLSPEIDYINRFSGQVGRVTADKDGNIYQLLSKEDGVHILKWEKR